MIDYKQFREHIVQRTLRELDDCIPYSEEAVDILMMTVAHESKGGKFLVQQGGPALGPYQMEPSTRKDIQYNFLAYRNTLRAAVEVLENEKQHPDIQLVSNFAYATAMARVHYFRVSEPLPSRDSTRYLYELSEYCKKYWNTELGKATPAKYRLDFLEWEKK